MQNIKKVAWVLLLSFLSGCSQSKNPENKQERVVSHNITQKIISRDVMPVVVLGGGIAGLTSAIYLAQANIPVLVIEGPKPGGALSQSHAVRNWPGAYNEPGLNIVQKIKDHAIACGAQVLQARVTAVNVRQSPFTFELDSMEDGQKTTIKAKACIVAMGTEPNFLNVPGERGDNGYWGRGVSNCATCDGFFFKGKRVAVVGGGDSAVEEASYLADLAQHVTVIVRKDAFRAKDISALDRLLARKNVAVLFNSQIKEIKGDGTKVTGVILNREDGVTKVDGIFLGIGSRPNTKLFEGQVELSEHGFMVLKDYQATSVPGLFAAGDIADPHFVQAITAAGDGCRAALQAKKYLEETK